MATKTEIMTLAAAKRGAKFLDKAIGRSWRKKIRRRELDLASPRYERGSCGCILAQLDANGSYYDMQRELGLNNAAVGRLGFDALFNEDAGEYFYDHDVLTDAWKKVIREGL